MANLNKFNSAVQALGNGNFDFGADTLKIGLSNTAPSASADVHWTDITEIAAGNGYTAGGTAVGGVSWTNAAGTSTLAGNAVTFTASGGNIGPFQYIVIYDSTTGYLLGWWDNGSAVTLANGNSFTINPNGQATGGTILTFT